MSDAPSSDQDSGDGGVRHDNRSDSYDSKHAVTSESTYSGSPVSLHPGKEQAQSPNSCTSGNSTDLDENGSNDVCDQPSNSSCSLTTSPDDRRRRSSVGCSNHRPQFNIELEAVVSCSSDGLVVVLRSARQCNPSYRTNSA